MRLNRILIAFVGPLLCASLAHATVHQYDLLNEIPQVTIIGPRTPEYVAAAEAMRARLLKQLAYWQERGLPDPPDLEGIYIFSDPSDLTVLDILNVLNPGRANSTERLNVIEHMTKQREALLNSEFLKAANQMRRKRFSDKYSRDDLINFAFDYYCLFRYGFAVTDTFTAVTKGLKFSETKPFVMAPIKDNAFYGTFPRVDLSEILKPAEKGSKPTEWDVLSSIDGEALTKRLRGAAGRSIFSRRIVILPRSTEGEGPDDLNLISSVADPTIDTHELGHHINSSLAEDHGSLNRMFEEIFADYSTASPFDNPVVGQHFAVASALIAQRLAERTDLTLEETKYRAAFEKIGAKGFLRNFATPASLDSVDRHHVLSNSYDGGDPARYFLFNVRERLSERERLEFDTITLEVIREIGHLPKVISTTNSFKVLFRSVRKSLKRFAWTQRERNKILASGDQRVADLRTRAEAELRADPDEMKKFNAIVKKDPSKKDAELKKRVDRRAAAIVSADGYSIQTAAEVAATNKLKALEKERQTQRGFMGELLRRPSVEADYALPELFRAYYRVAQDRAPELVPTLLEEMERVTNMKPVPLEMNDGSTEIALVRRTWTHNWLLARSSVRGYLNTLHELRPRITDLRSQDDREAVADDLSKLEKEYDVALEHLQAFERTNSVIRMVFSSPVVQLGRAFLKRKAHLDKDQQKVLDTCASRLASF